MFVLRTISGYVDFSRVNHREYGLPLDRAQRFYTVLDAMCAVQRAQAVLTSEEIKCGRSHEFPLSTTLTIERVVTKTKIIETTEAL